MQIWNTQWGNSIRFSHGSEHSAGVITLKNRFHGEVVQSVSDPEGHFVCMLLNCNDVFILQLMFMGIIGKSENDSLLGTVGNTFKGWLDKYPNAYIIMGGGF